MSPPEDERPQEFSAFEDSSLLAQAGVGVAGLTPGGRIAAPNGAFVDLTSYPRDRLVGTPFTRLLTTIPPPLEPVLAGGSDADTPLELTLPIVTDAGDVIACESLFRSVPGTDGTDGGFVVLLYEASTGGTTLPGDSGGPPEDDIAPAKAFVALADALSDGIIVLDTESRIQYANPSVERILGYAPDELVGGSKLSIIPERLREAHLNALNRYLETGERNIDWEYVELPGRHRDGHEVPLGISLNDFFFDGKRYFVGLFRDISPRKEAERALRARERRLDRYREYTDAVLDAVEDMFYVLDEGGNLQRWNETLREVTGYTDAEISSMHALDFFEEDDRPLIAETVEDGFESGHTRVEADLLTKDGERIPYEFVASTLEDPDDRPVLAGIGRDITERRERRRRLETSNERLEQFAYAASHDLQEPLRMVSSYLQLLERRYEADLDAEAREFIEYAVDGAERMREMVDGLLEYSRVETQGGSMEPVDLNAVVDDVTDDLQVKIEESSATLRREELPTVSGDGSQLRQLFQNLLSNAIEYSGDRRPEIEISVERSGDVWRIGVHDNGVGIPAEETDRVFEVFQRLHTRNERAGTGLGLAICQRIVERHGGRIWIESDSGGGSTFFVTLPDAAGDGRET